MCCGKCSGAKCPKGSYLLMSHGLGEFLDHANGFLLDSNIADILTAHATVVDFRNATEISNWRFDFVSVDAVEIDEESHSTLLFAECCFIGTRSGDTDATPEAMLVDFVAEVFDATKIEVRVDAVDLDHEFYGIVVTHKEVAPTEDSAATLEKAFRVFPSNN